MFGLFLFLSFSFVVWLFAHASARITTILFLPMLAFIALFGLNLSIQSILGRSDQEGFFYSGLRRFSEFGPGSLSVGIPVVLIVAVLISFGLGLSEDLLATSGLLVAWLTFHAHIAVHECGHYLAAKGVGLSPTRVVVGPLELRESKGRWAPRVSQDWFSLFSGLVESHSPSGVPSPLQSLKVALGGPLATALALAGFVYWNPYSFEQLLAIPNGPTGHFFAAGLFVGIFMLCFNLLPSRLGPGGFPTDGWQIHAAIRDLRER